MNIVFFGSSHFAVPSLEALLAAKHNISCVVTQPDREKGRGLHLAGTAVKEMAKRSAIKVYQPYRINLREEVELLKGLNPDLFVVIAYGQILCKEILDIPKIFSINIHASLLPKYRGAAPINWAIINGEKVSGVTVIKLTEEMDAGPIILQKPVHISEDDTFTSLEKELSEAAALILLDSLVVIENNRLNLIQQEKNEVTFAPKLKKENGLIDWRDSAVNIVNLIRACSNWPGTFTYFKGKLLKIHKAKVIETDSLPDGNIHGRVIKVSKEGILIAAGTGSLLIEQLQLEGKRVLSCEEFIAGHKISLGEIFAKKN